MKAKRTTISDIAAKSGYSKTAVSFAFNCPERISVEAKEKILAIAKELDYMPDPMARNFSLGKHMSIGFLLPQVIESSLSNPFTQGVIRGMGSICEEHGYVLTLIPPMNSSISEAIRNATVDGLIAMGIFFDQSINEVMRRRKLPFVVLDGIDNEDAATVTIDDRKAAETSMRAALEAGHRNIAAISLPTDAFAASTPETANTIVKRRLLGFEDALRKYGMTLDDIILSSAETTLEDGRRAAGEMLEKSSPTCFVCMSDIVAMGVRSAIKNKGLKCPEDISVIGFDGIFDSDITGVDLTTIIQSPEEKGKKAAEILFRLINGGDEYVNHEVAFSFHPGSTLRAL